jgi:uncharacterized protein YjbI with pentapeptide repeats
MDREELLIKFTAGIRDFEMVDLSNLDLSGLSLVGINLSNSNYSVEEDLFSDK